MGTVMDTFHVRVYWDITHDWSGWIEAADWIEAANTFMNRLRKKVKVPESAMMTVRAKKKCSTQLSGA